MALRRELLSYVGTGAIGGVVGYYVGAKRILGIQSVNTQSSANQSDGNSSTESESTDTSITTSMSAQQGLAYNDGFIYMVNDGKINKLDKSSTEVVNSFSVPDGSRSRGLAYGADSLWFADRVGSDYDGEVAELDPDTGEVQSSIQSTWDPRGLAFGGGSLWAVDITTNRIVEYSTDGDVLNSFDTGGVTWGLGLAYFDGSLWLGNNCNNNGCTVSLREYSTDGELLQQTGTRTETGYGGLAATDSELLGPDTDGTLTVLRTL